MKLSICIPTYNRALFLKWTLERLERNFSDAEIIISDNASTDDTGWNNASKAGYIKQPHNIGAFDNMHSALSAASGEYAIYCADDDYLLPEEVEYAIAYLDDHPEIGAYCAPCELWNEVESKPLWKAFEITEPMTFDDTADERVALFNFIIQHHVWPEHIIYRTPVPIERRTRAYWAFADIPDILDRAGAIHFDPTPFYRNVLIHPLGERTQLGMQQCLTDFEEYRAGLEVLAFGLFGGDLPYQARRKIQDMIQAFICVRLDLAASIHERQGNHEKAQVLRKRIAIASPVQDKVTAEV